jgi:multiple antibiotic resistance protein
LERNTGTAAAPSASGTPHSGLPARQRGTRLRAGVRADSCRPGLDMSLESLIAAFVTLFVIIDPVGIAPIFLALTGDRTPAGRRRVALRAVLIAAAVLILFALVGRWLLGAMGITLAAFRVAGGLLLFWISFEMVFERRQQRKSTTAERSVAEEAHDDVAAVPLAVPLLAGPGAITAVILLAAPAGSDAVRLALVVGVVLAVLAATLAVLLVAVPLDRIMGNTVRMVVTRLLGVVLAALAVQFVADGVLALAGTT